MVRVLGMAASLRNARFGAGNLALVSDLGNISTVQALREYLRRHTQFRFDDFVKAGRDEGLSFDKIYSKLRSLRGERGLSNSEAALAAALWGAKQEGAEIGHLSLAAHFPPSGRGRDLDLLRHELETADALILSGPVYFGDRGSLAQSLIEFIAADEDLRRACRGKVYAGIAVGAKRNGGQETTLIYQMLDMVNLDFFAVGNSSATTSQYGGTAVAGDVGKLHSDDYGIDTSIGTGRRSAHVAKLLARGRTQVRRERDPLRLHLWLLQDDQQRTGLGMFEDWARKISAAEPDIDARIFDIAASEVVRCIACDICPTQRGPKDEYRCIITAADDFFVKNHHALISADAILLCAYSPKARGNVSSEYQQFIERTRYLRRDDYVFSDLLTAPFVITELGARQNLHLRMLTSIIRHHTVVHHPIIGTIHKGTLLDGDSLLDAGVGFVGAARSLKRGRQFIGRREDLVYRPVGYEISAYEHKSAVTG